MRRLDDPDRRLVHELAAGVLRGQSTLDARLAPLVPRGWASVAPELQEVLRLGAFQLTALDRVPAHAAVDTSVALAKEAGGARAGGFVNAVLRRLGRTAASPPESDGSAAALAESASHPPWLVERWLRRFGPVETAELLRWNNTRPRLVLQPARATAAAIDRRLREAGIAVSTAPFDAGLVAARSRPQLLPGYDDGDFIVQDPAQALLVRFADLPRGTPVYDACAAPGGKAIGLGRVAGLVVAGDASRSRVRRLGENLRRAGSGREHVIVADARRPPVRAGSAVLLDAPCLGTGTFARHPDARWRVSAEALVRLAEQQSDLLEGAATAVAPGGILIYSTCSIEPEENAKQVDRFLDRHPEFRREPTDRLAAALLSPEGDLTTLPQRHQVDGAFAARLRRST